MRTWTPEARAAQSALLRKMKPWTKSTGPRTQSGKAKAAKNSYKTGAHSKIVKQAQKYFRECRAYLKFLKTNYYDLPDFHGPMHRTAASFPAKSSGHIVRRLARPIDGS